MIGGTTGDLAKAVLSASSALDVFGNVRTDLHSYQDAVTSDALAQLAVATTTQQLSAAQSIVTSARGRAAGAQTALRKFAVDEYMSSGLYQASPLVSGTNNGPFGTQTQNGVVAHQYATVVASDLLAQTQEATAAVKAALGQRNAVQKTLQQNETVLTSDNANESHSLVRLVGDVETLQKAGACTTAVIAMPTPAAAPGASTPSSPSGSSTAPSTTTTTVAPTTTTTSSTTTTTTTTPGGVSLVKPLGTTTTTTVPPPTTTTTVAPTTTTTTVPSGPGSGTSTAPVPTANPGGLQVLQGCVTALAPSASA
jgi:hypothetical protein